MVKNYKNYRNDSAKKIIEQKKKETLANQVSGNQKLLDLGLTQAEATALTGYKPPEDEE